VFIFLEVPRGNSWDRDLVRRGAIKITSPVTTHLMKQKNDILSTIF